MGPSSAHSAAGPCRRCRKTSRLPAAPGTGDGVSAIRVKPSATPAAATWSTTRRRTAGSRTTPRLPISGRPASNCGLTSTTTSPSAASNAGTVGRIRVAEMNETSMVTTSTVRRSAGSRSDGQVAGVDAVEHGHPRVLAQPPGDLPAPDVERGDPARAALEGRVGEPARRSSDVEHQAAAHRNAERVEGVSELDAAAPHVAVVGPDQADAGRLRDRRSRLRADDVVDPYLARQNQCSRSCPRRRQAALHHQGVEPHRAHHRR